jgi:hypothetical protein
VKGDRRNKVKVDKSCCLSNGGGGEAEAHWPNVFAAGAYLKRDGLSTNILCIHSSLRMQNSSSETSLTPYHLLLYSGREIAVEVESY